MLDLDHSPAALREIPVTARMDQDGAEQPKLVSKVTGAPGAAPLPEHDALPDDPLDARHERQEALRSVRGGALERRLPPARTAPRDRLPGPRPR